MNELRLGKTPATTDPRDLLFARYRDVEVTLPKAFGYGKLITDWGMLGNGPDPQMPAGFAGAGDCVWAGAAHETILLNAARNLELPPGSRRLVSFTTPGVLSDYSAVTGYDPATGAHDDGTDVHNALTYRRKTGILDAAGQRHKIGAFVRLDPGNLTELLDALYLFGAVGIGIEFPTYAMDQFSAGKPWTVRRGGQVEGGHYIPIVLNPLEVVTWARLQKMTPGFLHTYCDEAWVYISPDYLAAGKAPNGFDLTALARDLAALGAPA